MPLQGGIGAGAGRLRQQSVSFPRAGLQQEQLEPAGVLTRACLRCGGPDTAHEGQRIGSTTALARRHSMEAT